MKKTFITLTTGACLGFTGLWANPNHPQEIPIEVWSTQAFHHSFYDDEPVEIFFRVKERGYLTVYQINPWGGVEIIYPTPRHHWRPIRAGRIYKLSDLASDICIQYPGANGAAYIGFVVTENPTHIVPWLEQAFCDAGLYLGRKTEAYFRYDRHDFDRIIARIESDIRFRLGSNCRPIFSVVSFNIRPRPPVRLFHYDRDYWPQRPRFYPRRPSYPRPKERVHDPPPTERSYDPPPNPGSWWKKRSFPRRGAQPPGFEKEVKPPAKPKKKSDQPRFKKRSSTSQKPKMKRPASKSKSEQKAPEKKQSNKNSRRVRKNKN